MEQQPLQRKQRMSKTRYTSAELDARLKFALGIMLGTILLATTLGILYALIFVTQPVNAQSENDKMFFNVLGSVATFITGTLAGLLIGKSGAQEMKEAMENSATSTETTSEEPVATSPEQVVEEIASGKPNDQMPEETDVDEDWDKD
jgi:ABC-type multidrug transport system fused ATPase/permease subunit